MLQHNASQNKKQEVRAPLENLTKVLKEMPLTELNLQQMDQLEAMDVAQFLGDRGAVNVRKLVTQSSYDPASSANEVGVASSTVASAVTKFEVLVSALKASQFDEHRSAKGIGILSKEAIARIHFKEEASIGNIADMKKWASDWNDIVRGIGHLVQETPQDLRVVSAGNGSLIIGISGSMAVIAILAHLSKKVSGIVLDGVRVANAIEDLRHKKLMNADIEKEMRKNIAAKESNLVKETIAELKVGASENYGQEHDAHLETAVKKYVAFAKKGGEVDYLEPPSVYTDDLPEPDQIVSELRKLIAEVRDIKAETMLLTDQSIQDEV